MTLAAGTSLGAYEILAPLGAGGMGEVYRARDTKLDREVAIKILPDLFSRDPERIARFQREAKVLASLNHPNIAAIYGFETEGAQQSSTSDTPQGQDPAPRKAIHFLVMELVEGETLAERIKLAPMSVEESLSVGKQMAEALEAAHEQGVIHRDLKPANVKVTPEGKVKVLDFGLAKAMAIADERSQTATANSPTITIGHSPTAPGVILGTAAYMSPEQARGKRLDKRTDIWSFGVVLLECLTGGALFGGETISDSIGAVLHKDPDWTLLPPATPPTVHLLLRRCLTRDTSRRLRDIGDARIELENAIADPTSSSLGLATAAIAADASRGGRGRGRVGRTIALIAIVATLAAAVAWNIKPDPQAPVRKFTIAVTDHDTRLGIAISPDGRKIVYSVDRRLWVRELDKLEPRELIGTDNASQPIWSPDSTRIAYGVENKLWYVPWQGGTPTAVGTLPVAMLPVGGLSWTEDGRILIATGNTGLHEVSARGGEVRTILAVDPATEEDFHHAAALPDGRGVLFTVHRKAGGPDKIDLWTPTERKTLIEMVGERFDNPIYSPTGHILFARATTTPGLWAIPFSLTTLEATGEPFLVTSDAERPGVSQDGTLIFLRGTRSALSQMVWVDRSGNVIEPVGQPQAVIENPRLSPDGTRIAVNAREPDFRNIWIHDIARGTKTRLTFDKIGSANPIWIRGGGQVVYGTGAGLRGTSWIRNVDGSGEPVDLPIVHPTSCSSDGKFLLYQQEGINGTENIWYLPLENGGTPVPFIESSNRNQNGIFSPDGTLVAYEHRTGGAEEIFLTNFPSREGRWQVSVKSGTNPRWSLKGDELFYIEVSSFNLMSVAVEREPTLKLGTPKRLFSGITPGVALFSGYDVGPDGERFLMVQIDDPGADKRGIAVVENWFAEFEDHR